MPICSQTPPAYLSLQKRRYLLYTALAKRLQQIRQPDEIFIPKPRTSAADLNERVDAAGIGAIRQNRLYVAFRILKAHTILAPVVPILKQFELLSV
jgi:hypothetical protein